MFYFQTIPNALCMSVISMDATFLEDVKDTQFTCLCGWVGTELELDVLTHSLENLVCCPACQNDDVRVLNN